MSEIGAEPIPGRRLILVPLRADHAADMTHVLSDPRLYAFTGGTPPTTDELRARYERWLAGSPDPSETWLNWIISLRARPPANQPPTVVGTVQATITRNGDHPAEAEIAWIVGTPWQGQGLATEAAQALVHWLQSQATATIGIIKAHIHPSHHASAAVARAVGLAPTDHWHDGERRWQLRAALPQ